MMTTSVDYENALIEAILLAIGELSRLDDRAAPMLAVHVDLVRRALLTCLEIVERLGDPESVAECGARFDLHGGNAKPLS